MVLYGCETWVITKRTEILLNAWERQILRIIYGPVNDHGEWRIRTNAEVYALYEEPTLIAEARRARLRWLGHVERMPESRGITRREDASQAARENAGWTM